MKVIVVFALVTVAAVCAHEHKSQGFDFKVEHNHQPAHHVHHIAAPEVHHTAENHGREAYHHAAAPVHHAVKSHGHETHEHESHHASEATHHGHESHNDYYHHPSYKFEYGVHDPHTKDHKTQWEHRDGDVVKGEYTLDEADGTHRVVKYSSDDKNGFEAHVERIGHASHGHHHQGAHHGW